MVLGYVRNLSLNSSNLADERRHLGANQATAFAQQTSRQLSEQAKLAQAGFSLPKECDKAARVLQSFLGEFQKDIGGSLCW